jgi:hypothetical protein
MGSLGCARGEFRLGRIKTDDAKVFRSDQDCIAVDRAIALSRDWRGDRQKRRTSDSEPHGMRPVKSFDAILNAVVMELQGTPGSKVKMTLEIEASAANGFAEDDVSIVRDNTRQLKFKPDSTGFD